jgi:protein O-GlcNAc transferase
LPADFRALAESGGDAAGMKCTAVLDNGDVRLRPCRYGFMLYLVSDQCIGRSLDRYGEFCEGQVELFRQLIQPGWTILEIGANLGAHTVFLAKATGPRGAVYAFEPRRAVFQILCANVALNALGNVHARQVAVGRAAAAMTAAGPENAAAGVPAAAGSVMFVMPPSGGYSADDRLEPALPIGDRLPVIAIDSLDLPACNFIKVDAEGMEGDVIAGAGRTLRRFQPLLYVENSRQEKSASLIRQLLVLDYRLYWHMPPLFNPQNYFEVRENIFAGTVSVHMLGIHASVSQTVTGFREITSPQDSWRETAGSSPHDVRSVESRTAAGPGIPQALGPAPASAEELSHRGVALANQGRLDEAIVSFRRAVQDKPDWAQAHLNLGIALQEHGRLDEAMASYRRALELEPDFVEAYINLGNAFQDQGNLDDAVACFRRALELRPDFAEVHYNLGNALKNQGKLDDAVACYRRTLELEPDYAEAQMTLGNAFKDQGNLDEALACYHRALELKPDFVDAHCNLVYAQVFCPGYDAQTLYEELRRWNQQHAEPLGKFIQPHLNDRSPDRRLRVGYVSPNFRNHAESYFTLPLLSAHDHQNFEIFCYADVVCLDGITARLRSCADVWQNITGLSDEQVAQLVRQGRIDILVDLTMHMGRNRLLVFARKPAPVQVCWLAYQGTTGLSTIDYRLTDPYIDPPGLNDRYYSEESVRLPDAFWCYDPLASEPAVSALPALDTGHITFGCLNNFCKVNISVLRLWARVLKAVDRSQLMLLAAEGSHRQHTLDLLEQQGVKSDRVTFVAQRPHPPYLELYHRIDIGLDTFPYNGQTTSLDAFWLGVPVITIVGQTAVARAGLSLLRNLGLPELIAQTPEQFVSIAVGLANDLPRLRDLRATLRDRMQASPLMDAPRFARNVEAAYRTMWRRWCS